VKPVRPLWTGRPDRRGLAGRQRAGSGLNSNTRRLERFDVDTISGIAYQHNERGMARVKLDRLAMTLMSPPRRQGENAQQAMRFIGNKEAIAPAIRQLLQEKGLLHRDLTLFDACCGSGAVADALKDAFNVKINDLLAWSVVYTRGRLMAPKCTFAQLGFDPFARLDASDETLEGFFFKHYSPGQSARMYFTAENAARIDYIRAMIERWRRASSINEDEYAYLLASLIESLSAVANTAGVYGAYLKHWDPRALRRLRFAPVNASPAQPREVGVTNARIEDIVDTVDCDILYLDPPYTQNQYGTQYHLLETLVKDDAPSLSQVTGSRPVTPMRSDWSKDIHKQILFDRVIGTTKARHVIFSYSADGFMSKAYIETVLKRYAVPGSLVCRPIAYRKYTNTKSRESGDHLEYLFYIEKRPAQDVQYVSPLNYPGSKARMVPFLKDLMPKHVERFVDAFGGSFNVGINAAAKHVVYNDYNHLVTDLIATFREDDTYELIRYVRRQIAKYGLEKENAASYLTARARYNSLPIDKRDPRLLFAVLLYGFNQQIRFNSDLDFNNPVGQRWFNDKILERVVSFSRAIKSRDVVFHDVDYQLLLDQIDSSAFVYLDPPYRLTTGAYNDGKRGFKGWDIHAERELFAFCEQLHARSVKFMLSYVLEHKGRANNEISRWIKRNGFRIVRHETVQGIGRKEVVILNYG
jgi:adenine-specific DNA-methyltransferase